VTVVNQPSNPHKGDNHSQLPKIARPCAVYMWFCVALTRGCGSSAVAWGPSPYEKQSFPSCCLCRQSFCLILAMANPDSELFRDSPTNSGPRSMVRFSIQQALPRMIVKQFYYGAIQIIGLGGHPWLFPWHSDMHTSCCDSHCLQ
jgi:hypothetical protein